MLTWYIRSIVISTKLYQKLFPIVIRLLLRQRERPTGFLVNIKVGTVRISSIYHWQGNSQELIDRDTAQDYMILTIELLNNNNTVQRVAVSVSCTHEQTMNGTELQGVSSKVRPVKREGGIELNLS